MDILLISSVQSFIQLMATLLIFAFVLFITYLVTKWMGGYQKGRSSNNNLKIVESIQAGSNKSIHILQTGKKYLVIAVGKEEINVLTELSEEELDFSQQKESEEKRESFQEVISKMKDKFSK